MTPKGHRFGMDTMNFSHDVFRRLAAALDAMPSGFPATDSGIELRLLRKIFLPEEAELVLQLRQMPENVEGISRRVGRPADELRPLLERMASKGQIRRVVLRGETRYIQMPFIVGIWEEQLHRLDAEMIALFNEYSPLLSRGMGAFPPAVGRVVPVNKLIKADLEILRYEDVLRIIEGARSFQLRECICRKKAQIEGNPCRHPLETCLVFSRIEGAFSDPDALGREIGREEALRLLDATEKEGLVHCTFNVRDGQPFICNCCPCCCLFLDGLKRSDAPHVVARSNFLAAIDRERCSACGVCAEERCPMEAIVVDDGAYAVIGERCIGCGVCTITCPTEAISLVPRNEKQKSFPPADLLDWGRQRLANRGNTPTE